MPTCSLISTAVEKVALNFGKPDQKELDHVTLAEAKEYLAEGIHFAKGSMAPKIGAIIWFLEKWRQDSSHHRSAQYRSCTARRDRHAFLGRLNQKVVWGNRYTDFPKQAIGNTRFVTVFHKSRQR